MSFLGKTLYRNMENKMLFGICSGLSDFFNLDVNLIRLLFVLFSVSGGVGLIVYLVGIFIIPERPEDVEG